MSTKPEWSDAPEWFTHLAQDPDGSWWWFEDEPHIAGNGEWSNQPRKQFQQAFGRGTLEKRP